MNGYRGAKRLDDRWDVEIAIDKRWLDIAKGEAIKRQNAIDAKRWQDHLTELAKNNPDYRLVNN